MPAIKSPKRAAATDINEDCGSEKKLKLSAVTEAIERHDGLPQVVKDMVLVAVPASLGIPADERHEYQTEMVAVIGNELGHIQEKLEQEHDASKAALDEVKSMKGELEANAEKAKVNASEVEHDKKTKKYVLAEAMQKVVGKRSTLQEAEAAQQKETRVLERLEKEKAQLDACVEQHLKPLLDGAALEDREAAAHCKALESFALKLNLEESLAMSLNSALIKKPTDRSPFDGMVIEGLQKALDAKKAAMASSLEASNTTVSQVAATAASEQEESKALKAVLKISANEYTAVETSSKDAEAAKKTAMNALRGHSARQGEAEVQCDQKEATLTAFISHNMATFEELRIGNKVEEALAEAADAVPIVKAGGGA